MYSLPGCSHRSGMYCPAVGPQLASTLCIVAQGVHRPVCAGMWYLFVYSNTGSYVVVLLGERGCADETTALACCDLPALMCCGFSTSAQVDVSGHSTTGTAGVLVVHLPLPRVQSIWQTRMVPDATAGFIRIASCANTTSLVHTRISAVGPLDCANELLVK
jgi:hypothetical protein